VLVNHGNSESPQFHSFISVSKSGKSSHAYKSARRPVSVGASFVISQCILENGEWRFEPVERHYKEAQLTML
jgi:hypothetical protein